MAKLVGEFHHKLDAKGRVSLPSDFRKSLPKNLKVTQAPKETCLYVFEPDAFDDWVESLFASKGGYKPTLLEHERARRVLNSRATNVEIDSAGRISISADLRSKTGLDKEVVILGNSDHMEIWDAKRWDEFINGFDLSSLFE